MTVVELDATDTDLTLLDELVSDAAERGEWLLSTSTRLEI